MQNVCRNQYHGGIGSSVGAGCLYYSTRFYHNLRLVLFAFFLALKHRIAAARLERSSFCRSKAEVKKREWKAEIAAIKKHQQMNADVLFLI
ncbi:hypothetical protein EAG08_06295 [Chryseobacterium sp. 3008163]|nr:hypothetical protein EAG08_06295 [Chryseobacterium sp. 3008163]